MVHRLNVDESCKPVKQKRRAFNQERSEIVAEQVEELLKAGFIREVHYPQWISNVVLIQSNQDACTDQKKTSFVTSRGLYCYTVMPFGLKNAGETYQRMVNRMFAALIGKNIEVYVDDMLVKSRKNERHEEDLAEAFDVLLMYKMKLNPTKCTFGVTSGKFLGFLVHQRGIEANPDKIKAVLEMDPPKTLKQLEGLNGRITTLNRFVSRSTDKCLPFFKISRKKGQFEWTEECEAAFKELKPYLGILHKPDSSGRLVKWDVELSEYDIHYKPITAMKGEAVADFIAELTPTEPQVYCIDPQVVEEEKFWTLYLDGSSNFRGCGAELILISPDKERTEYVLRFSFHASNNEAEYEALLAGLKVARSGERGVTARLAAAYETDLRRTVPVEILPEPSIEAYEAMDIDEQGQPEKNWKSHLIKYLRDGILPTEKIEAQQLQRRATRYLLKDDNLYKRGYSLPLLKCITPDEADYIMREIHEGVSRSHSGARSLSHKIVGQGIPYTIISDNGKQFGNAAFREFCRELDIKHICSSPVHLQANWKVEAVNKIIKRTLKTRLEKLKGLWAEEIPNALWAYRTTPYTSTGETPFSLSFGSEVVVPVEIGLPSPMVEQFSPLDNNESVKLNLNLLEEHRETARLRTAEYKNRIARHYNSKVKKRDFKEGDLVLRKIMLNTKDSISDAFGPTWEGPYKVTKVVRIGTYALEDQRGEALLHP
ncbi:uncharacterized protein LOC111022476 [Momordica charantia]|uniref:Uncharacterized protein LOC111022476 n=1 Tax=Momordica charantia TaxID=3673 RepID=A0A6J1DP30_MOMCH|nr:uncharacterized protein LOC111022476 [Momordica charantia]